MKDTIAEELQDAEEALREIVMLCGYSDPSDGEGMSPQEVVAIVREMSDLIPVCENCLRASCWQGIFVCDRYRMANVVYRTRLALIRLKLEHPSYLKTDKELAEPKQRGAQYGAVTSTTPQG